MLSTNTVLPVRTTPTYKIFTRNLESQASRQKNPPNFDTRNPQVPGSNTTYSSTSTIVFGNVIVHKML